jgi:hypothetical protein
MRRCRRGGSRRPWRAQGPRPRLRWSSTRTGAAGAGETRCTAASPWWRRRWRPRKGRGNQAARHQRRAVFEKDPWGRGTTGCGSGTGGVQRSAKWSLRLCTGKNSEVRSRAIVHGLVDSESPANPNIESASGAPRLRRKSTLSEQRELRFQVWNGGFNGRPPSARGEDHGHRGRCGGKDEHHQAVRQARRRALGCLARGARPAAPHGARQSASPGRPRALLAEGAPAGTHKLKHSWLAGRFVMVSTR